MRVHPKETKDDGLIRDTTRDVINKSIDVLPIELNLPRYQYLRAGHKASKKIT